MNTIRAKLTHHYRFSIAALSLLVLLSVIITISHRANAATTVPTAGEHIITLHDDGVEKGFITKKATLREALADAHIALDPSDRTEPGLDEALVASTYQVNIYRARPIVIRDGEQTTTVLTSYRTVKQIAKQAEITLHDADKANIMPSQDPIKDGAAEVMTIHRATAFTFEFYGKTSQSYTMARTVGDMLREKGITMGKEDGVSPDVTSPLVAGMTVRLWRNGVQTITQDEDVAFDTKQVKDADHDLGYKEVQMPGQNGKKTVTYEINMQNGVEVSRKEINSNVTKQPVQQVEIIGTKVSLPAGSHEDWMAAAGISSGDFGYVNYIVMHEGGWEPCKVQGGAINCSYAANGGAMGYGIVQATPGAKMASAGADWATNPITQLRWATSYAVGRYGSWGGAYNHWLASHNW